MAMLDTRNMNLGNGGVRCTETRKYGIRYRGNLPLGLSTMDEARIGTNGAILRYLWRMVATGKQARKYSSARDTHLEGVGHQVA